MLYKGNLALGDKNIKVFEVEAIDKGVDTYFKGTAEHPVDEKTTGGVLTIHNENGGEIVIKNCVFTKGGTNFEGHGQE
ncbi:MAG: hypothetical protein LBM71_00740 [Elusimicrobiota bacterium]|jgi:hypothetical protein|nr:hypothetical protein [Elusimicrobiota bacterium]